VSGGDRGGGAEQAVRDCVIFTTEARRKKQERLAANEREEREKQARGVAADLRRKAQMKREQLAIGK
jgi:hypothetical protein